MPHNFFINQRINHHQREVDSARTAVGLAQSPMDIVRAIRTLPIAPAYLRCMASVRSAEVEFWITTEQKASEVLANSVRDLTSLVGSESFCQESAKLRRELNYLHHSTPRAVNTANRELIELQRQIADQPLPVFERQRA